MAHPPGFSVLFLAHVQKRGRQCRPCLRIQAFPSLSAAIPEKLLFCRTLYQFLEPWQDLFPGTRVMRMSLLAFRLFKDPEPVDGDLIPCRYAVHDHICGCLEYLLRICLAESCISAMLFTRSVLVIIKSPFPFLLFFCGNPAWIKLTSPVCFIFFPYGFCR